MSNNSSCFEIKTRMGFARQEAAKAWCTEITNKKEMDVDLANAFAEILVEHLYKPHLGCATTRELLEEIEARSDPKNDYQETKDS